MKNYHKLTNNTLIMKQMYNKMIKMSSCKTMSIKKITTKTTRRIDNTLKTIMILKNIVIMIVKILISNQSMKILLFHC